MLDADGEARRGTFFAIHPILQYIRNTNEGNYLRRCFFDGKKIWEAFGKDSEPTNGRTAEKDGCCLFRRSVQ